MSGRRPEAEPLLTPAEVATMFRVDAKTVTRWAKAGKLTSIKTLGGHRRYREAEVRALLEAVPETLDTRRCPKCTYIITSPGHRQKCGTAS
jgi:excisionase family DNA binding protein